jgi:autotransporter family porin
VSETITGTVTLGIVLGSAAYPGALTITATGLVAPEAAGIDAISAPATLSDASVDNRGRVFGGHGLGAQFSAYAGGAGIYLAGGGTVRNTGLIVGGTGGSSSYYGADGGDGVSLDGNGFLTNSGTITGGAGGDGAGAYNSGGNGGTGVDLSAGGTVINGGTIAGGGAGAGNYPAPGGTGVYLGAAGVVLNTGSIAGGAGNGAHFQGLGGAGVDLAGGGTLLNRGLITGGTPGSDAVHVGAAGVLENSGTITGGIGAGFGIVFDADAVVSNTGRIQGGTGVAGQGDAAPGGQGGTALLVRGAAILSNAAALQGGAGGTAGASGTGGAGGIGLIFEAAGRASNTGTIAGGQSGLGGVFGTGGDAIQFEGADIFTNFGTVAGGAGLADPGSPADTGRGGAGIYILQNSFVFNHALIVGGQSGYGGYGVRSVGTNTTLINSGTIAGGAGATGGGVGVYLNGGTLASAGMIAGGAGAGGARAEAVQFGQYAATLDIAPTARFEGGIAGNTHVTDTIELTGHGPGTLSGLGTSVQGITDFMADADSNWSLTGSLSGNGSLDIGAGARLTLNGACSIAKIAFAAGGDASLTLAKPLLLRSTIEGFAGGDTIGLLGILATSYTFRHDTLTLFNANHLAVDTLDFGAGLTGADFHLMETGPNTDITYAGAASSVGLDDPPGALPPWRTAVFLHGHRA